MITSEIRNLFRRALREDIGRGDVTTEALVPKHERGEAVIIAKESGIFCGGTIAREIFKLRDASLKIRLDAKEGSRIRKGQTVFTARGRIRPILEAERVALNFLGKLSGIATLTRTFVGQVRGTKSKILDTRKTTPLWRGLEKYAVRCGGAENHRSGLWDEVLVKDNHWAAIWRILEKTRCRYFTKKLWPLQRRRIPIEVEVQNLKELAHLLEGTLVPDRILLDNFSIKELRRAVLFLNGLDQVLRTRYGLRRKKPLLEASGGIHLNNIRQIAATGVDRISVGRLTHSAPAIDFSLKIKKVTSA